MDNLFNEQDYRGMLYIFSINTIMAKLDFSNELSAGSIFSEI